MVKIPAKHRFGVAAAVASALGAGVAATLALVPSASAAGDYYLTLTDVPPGVSSVAVASNGGYMGCFPVSPGVDTPTNNGVADGDVVLGRWYSDANCQTPTGHISKASVASQGTDTFLFRLASS
jgi:hypothetical protein